MIHKYPIGTKIKIVELQPYDERFNPELKVGMIGTVFGTNDYVPEIIVIDIDGKLYNMETDQIEAIIDSDIEPAVKAAEKCIDDLYKDVGEALSNMPKKEE